MQAQPRAMGVADGELASSTSVESTHKDESRDVAAGVSEIEADESWMSDGRRCGTAVRRAPASSDPHSDAASGPPRVSLEGLILKITNSELKIRKKLGEGAQAKIYVARYAPSGVDVVIKKFKDPFSAQVCAQQGQWPTALFNAPQFFVCQLIGYVEAPKRGYPISLVMVKYDGDLRSVINKKWPFKPQVALNIITQIAMGMKLLHDQGVTHNDLKAENLLVQKSEDNIPYAVFIGDFENSVRNEGTAFWRPPEVFPALRERDNSNSFCSNPLPFSKPGDVYSFGMVCYEILTGNIPFEGHPWSDYDFIPAGNRPELPGDLDVNLRDMILRCWVGDPNARPSFDDICSELRQRAEAVEDGATRSAVMPNFQVFDEFCRGKPGPEEGVWELKRILQKLAQDHGSETEFVRLGFELVVLMEQFMFEFGSLSSSFIDTPVLPFSKWLQRMWLCNTVQFRRYEFIDALPSDIAPTYNIVKLLWELTARIGDGQEESNWGEDDSMTQEEKLAALKAFVKEQGRRLRLQKRQGLSSLCSTLFHTKMFV